jgi:hypothetical protein
MAITKAELVTALNTDLNRSETTTTAARAIRRALEHLSGLKLWKDLHTSGTAAIVAGNTSFAAPTGLRVVDAIVLSDGTYDSLPMEPIAWRDLLTDREGSQSQSEPTHYIYRGRTIEFGPQADASYTATVRYWRSHPDQDAILFGDAFKTALEYATQAFYLSGKGLTADPKFAEVRDLYMDEVGGLGSEADTITRCVKYRDI